MIVVTGATGKIGKELVRWRDRAGVPGVRDGCNVLNWRII